MTLNTISPKLESIWFEDEYKPNKTTSYSKTRLTRNTLKNILPSTRSNILQLFDLEDNKINREPVSISTPFSFKHVSHIDDTESFGLDKSFKTNDLPLMTQLMSPSQNVEEEFESAEADVEDVESTAATKTTLDPGASPLAEMKKTDSLPFQAFSSFRTTPTTSAPEYDEVSRRRHTRNYSTASSTNLLRSNSTFTRTTSISTLNTIVSNEVSPPRNQYLAKKHISISNSLSSLTANSSYQYSYYGHEKSDTLNAQISRHERIPSEGDDFISQPIKEEEEEFSFDETHEDGYESANIDPSIMEEPSSAEDETTGRGSGFSDFSYVGSSSSSHEETKCIAEVAQLASPIALSTDILHSEEEMDDEFSEVEQVEQVEEVDDSAPIELFEIDNKTIEDEYDREHSVEQLENIEEEDEYDMGELNPPHIRKVSSISSPKHSRNSSFTFELLETPKFEKVDFSSWSPSISSVSQLRTSKSGSIDLDLLENASDDEELENTIMAVNAANYIRSSRLSFHPSSSGLDRLASGASLRNANANATLSQLRLPEIEDEDDI